MCIRDRVTAALAGTNALTEGVIARRAEETENAARRQVIDADSFEKATLTDEGEEVVYYLAQKDGATVGYVFTTVTTGKSSGLTVMTGLDTAGTVTGVQVTADNETAGYVDKVVNGGLLDAMKGQNVPDGLDVYKRQLPRRTRIRPCTRPPPVSAAAGACRPCLLYTSRCV